MSVCEVYEMRADVEPQCIAEDSEVRIYLSAVRSSREEIERRKKERQKAVIREKKKRKLCSQMKYRAMKYSRSIISLAGAVLFGSWMSDKFYLLRGYSSIGGEVLLIPMVFAVTYWVLGVFLGGRYETEE